MKARYRYRLRVTPTQAAQLQAVFDANRFVWNQALGRWNDLWKYEGLRYSTVDMCAELTDWRSRFDWLAAQPAQSQQQSIRDLGHAIAAFFDRSNPAQRPKFKKKATATSGRWTVEGFALRDDRLHVSVAGGRVSLRVVWSQRLPSVPKSVTVYRGSTGHWWASFVTEQAPERLAPTGQITGLDLGLNTFATTEFDDADIANPRLGRAGAKVLARSQRDFRRKTVGSKRQAAAKVRVAKVHAKIANQRRDFHQKEARNLARRFDRIGVEKLRIKNMARNGHLARSIYDAGWGNFLLALEWQAKKCGHEVVRMKAYNTTQNCSACGTKAKSHVGSKQRTFECDVCGLVIDRDRNAARNLNPGWAVPGDPVDGNKTKALASVGAARGTKSVGCTPAEQSKGYARLVRIS